MHAARMATLVRITGTFSVEELAGDFSAPRYAFARRLGETLAAVSDADWLTIERATRALWDPHTAQLSWDEARPAIFMGWTVARRAFGEAHNP